LSIEQADADRVLETGNDGRDDRLGYP
jgi:hypothetical protein